MAGMLKLALLLAFGRSTAVKVEHQTVYSALAELPVDENGRLSTHMLLLPQGCTTMDLPPVLEERVVGVADGDLADDLKLTDMCPSAVALEMGTELAHVPYHNERFVGAAEQLPGFLQAIAQVEVGWINFYTPHDQALKVFWVNPRNGGETLQADLAWGEPKTHWRTVFLGHKFVVKDPDGKIVGEMTATKHEIFVVGKQEPLPEAWTAIKDRSREIEQTDVYEHKRAARVKRTFTEHGFKKTPVPLAVFGSIRAYYYNNRAHLAREDWGGKGLYVNWWESEPYMIQPPFGLKQKWHDALRPLAEEWIGGVELEDTDLYGMRKYAQGAKLLKHVDREQTHAVSMIINVDQSDDLESGAVAPWQLDIDDHQSGESRLVTMHTGDMVFYESARCLHGRPDPLQGQYYVNLFSHYRPKGNPNWFQEELATAPGPNGNAVALAEAIEAQGGASEAEGMPNPKQPPVPPKRPSLASRLQDVAAPGLKSLHAAASAFRDSTKSKSGDSGDGGDSSESNPDNQASEEEGDGVEQPVHRRMVAHLHDSHAKAVAHVKHHMKQHPEAVGVAARVLKPFGLHGTLFRNPILLLASVVALLAATTTALCVCCLRPRRAHKARAAHKKDGVFGEEEENGGFGSGAPSAYGSSAGAFGGGIARRSAASSGAASGGNSCSSDAGGLLAGAPGGSSSGGDSLDPKVRAAAASGKYAVVKAWVDAAVKAGRSLDVGDGHERTALHLAAKAGHDDVVKLLLVKGAYPSPRDAGRQVTPLHLAAMEGRGPCVKRLLDAGADPFLEDIDRATPLQLAKAAGNVGCTLLLERAEAAGLAHDQSGPSHNQSNGSLSSLDKESV